eukprot:3206445-Prymnesium_polylepis.1
MQLWNDEYSCRGVPEIDNWSLVHEAERYPYDKYPLKESSVQGFATRTRRAAAWQSRAVRVSSGMSFSPPQP